MGWIDVLKTIAALAGILGLILGLAYVLRRLNLGGRFSDSSSEGWRILGTKMLGPKRQIYVLEVGSSLLLVGTTEKTMTPLMEIRDPADRQAVIEAVTRKPHGAPSFRDLLKRAES
ncbi:flagellar biosynthetic protein FliO [bacterium]|nr:flagellar biosynthetic protein FliO [bacterium]MBU1983822.1 flagellar biosynthetic protein FliO [bacterium]